MNEAEIDLQRQVNDVDEDCIYRSVAKDKGTIIVRMIASLNDVNIESVLDVGCRHGDTLLQIHDLAPTLTLVGVDIVPEFLEEIREAGLEAVQSNAEELPFEDQSFDVVFTSHTLEHCHNPEKAMRECFRVARRAVYIVVPFEKEEQWKKNPGHHFHASHPVDWWKMYLDVDSKREFIPTYYRMSDHSDVDMVFMRIPE